MTHATPPAINHASASFSWRSLSTLSTN
jgi:hypothetical protein